MPFVPNLEDYNFDATELGDDEEEFTGMVHEDISPEGCVQSYKEYHRSGVLSEVAHPIVEELRDEVESARNSVARHSRDPSPSSHHNTSSNNPFAKIKKHSSTHKLK